MIVGEHEELPNTELNEGSMTADPEIEKLLENGNMEQLATLVLNGEGRRLVGRHSGNPELQAFIDRVPSYMVLRAMFTKNSSCPSWLSTPSTSSLQEDYHYITAVNRLFSGILIGGFCTV